ncbi:MULTISPECIES: ADP-ribosylglycohydrolase family protein [unclassified Cytobacillus]|uniref:ADP-ribosylglycohydrolase family protein n=1 Tax=unclassified Cytobacillus TaxID=2675268 RepID=UPI00203F627F|nr:ADP-ribosylglycohydrolase family protein [Cytobacillus sp. AMY 15.2]MCM3090687.1 ADP-ribosylglycohydrolase family protein [Cytobacillus sp. AMY 15.2]
MVTFKERVRGIVLSTALGDAMGAPVEKLSYEEIKKMYRRVESLRTRWYKGDYPADLNLGRRRGNGTVTDDTLMTVALINVYNKEKRHIDAYDMGNEFVKEIAFNKTYIPEFGREALIIDRLFYPEKYIFMRHVLANCEPREGGIGNMINCGAAMYIAPVGIVNAGNPKAAYDEAILFAMGHQSSYGLEAAGVLAACVAKAFEENVTVDEIVETALYFAKDGTKNAIRDLTAAARKLHSEGADMDTVISTFQNVIEPYSPMKDDVHRKMEKVGVPSNHYTPSRLFSIEELPMALAFMVLNDGDYYGTILDGINSGRDTDSIGVMAGVILGAMYGERVIRSEDVELLQETNKMNLLETADQFSETAKLIIEQDLQLNEKRKNLL